jgi:hypothetical protein
MPALGAPLLKDLALQLPSSDSDPLGRSVVDAEGLEEPQDFGGVSRAQSLLMVMPVAGLPPITPRESFAARSLHAPCCSPRRFSSHRSSDRISLFDVFGATDPSNVTSQSSASAEMPVAICGACGSIIPRPPKCNE